MTIIIDCRNNYIGFPLLFSVLSRIIAGSISNYYSYLTLYDPWSVENAKEKKLSKRFVYPFSIAMYIDCLHVSRIYFCVELKSYPCLSLRHLVQVFLSTRPEYPEEYMLPANFLFILLIKV